MTSSNPDLDEASQLFTLLEERMRVSYNGDLDYVTETIALTGRVLDALSWCIAREDRGNVVRLREMTLRYLLWSLNLRGTETGIRSLLSEAAENYAHVSYAQQALADLDRAEKLAAELNELDGRGSSYHHHDGNMQFTLIMRLGLYDRAFAHAQQLIERFPESGAGYAELRLCYLNIRDYARALDAANEEIKRAYNNETRRDAFRGRASVYRAMGDEASAERDLDEAKQYYPKS